MGIENQRLAHALAMIHQIAERARDKGDELTEVWAYHAWLDLGGEHESHDDICETCPRFEYTDDEGGLPVAAQQQQA